MPFCRRQQVLFAEKTSLILENMAKHTDRGPVVETGPLSLEWCFRLRSEQAQLTGGGFCVSGQFYGVEV